METMEDENKCMLKPTWPWDVDRNGLPVLDSMELIVLYAAAVLHRHVAAHEVHWEPCDLESVHLYVGRRWEDTFAEAMSNMNGDMEAMRRMQEVMRQKPMQLGRVNWVAADVLVRRQDGM